MYSGIRNILVGLGVLLSITSMCQEVELRWLVDDDAEPVFYSLALDGFEEVKDSIELENDTLNMMMQKILSQLEMQAYTALYPNDSDQVDVRVWAELKGQNAQFDSASITDYHPVSVHNITINSVGELTSFWSPPESKQFGALLFQLPKTPVSVGDSWVLDVSILQSDPKFVCDSSASSMVCTLSQVYEENGDQIAIIDYNLTQFVTGSITMLGGIPYTKLATYSGQGHFNVTKGYWTSYDCDYQVLLNDYPASGYPLHYALELIQGQRD